MDTNLFLRKINFFNSHNNDNKFYYELAPNYKNFVKKLPFEAQTLFFLFKYIQQNNKIMEVKEYNECQNLGECIKIMEIKDNDLSKSGDWIYSIKYNKYYFVNFSFLSNPQLHMYTKETFYLKEIIKQECNISI